MAYPTEQPSQYKPEEQWTEWEREQYKLSGNAPKWDQPEQASTGDPRNWQSWRQWTSLWDAMQTGQDPRGALSDVIKNFQGNDARDLQFFMEHPAWRTMTAYSLKDSPAWKKMAGMEFPKEQLISAGMGQIGTAGRQAVDQGMAALQQGGLGRSAGATAAIQRGSRVATGQAGANLQAAIGEQAYNAESARLGNLLQLEQAMQSIALGISPDRRTESNKPGAGDWLALVGKLAGTAAALCWVAREVYGAADVRWVLFRYWLRTQAPPWFQRLYRKHGPWFARVLRRLPFLKRPIRAWMDRKIASLPERISVS